MKKYFYNFKLMNNKSIEEVAKRIAQKLSPLPIKEIENILRKLLKPCIIGLPTINTNNLSKIGDFPLLPKGFDLPMFEGQNLQFFGQFNLADFSSMDIEKILPESGLLVIFMYLKNNKGKFTIPNFEQKHLQSFYFENIDELVELQNESIRCKHLIETKFTFNSFMDFPESRDFHLSKTDQFINKDLSITHDLLPKEYEVSSSYFKILGYPTDDALNTYPEWYFFEQETNLMSPGDKSHLYKKAKLFQNDYRLLLQIDLIDIDALKLEDEIGDFGGISIGIKKTDLKNKNFSNLLFKYTMS